MLHGTSNRPVSVDGSHSLTIYHLDLTVPNGRNMQCTAKQQSHSCPCNQPLPCATVRRACLNREQCNACNFCNADLLHDITSIQHLQQVMLRCERSTEKVPQPRPCEYIDLCWGEQITRALAKQRW